SGSPGANLTFVSSEFERPVRAKPRTKSLGCARQGVSTSLDMSGFVGLGITARRLPIRRIGGKVRRQRALPFVAVLEKLRLVVDQLLAGLGREIHVRPLDDGIDRAGLLAQAAIDALGHVDVVAR